MVQFSSFLVLWPFKVLHTTFHSQVNEHWTLKPMTIQQNMQPELQCNEIKVLQEGSSDVYSYSFIYYYLFLCSPNPLTQPRSHMKRISLCLCVSIWNCGLVFHARHDIGFLMVPKVSLPFPLNQFGLFCTLLYDILMSSFAYLCRQHTDQGNMCICRLCSVRDIQYLPLLWRSLINCAQNIL